MNIVFHASRILNQYNFPVGKANVEPHLLKCLEVVCVIGLLRQDMSLPGFSHTEDLLGPPMSQSFPTGTDIAPWWNVLGSLQLRQVPGQYHVLC